MMKCYTVSGGVVREGIALADSPRPEVAVGASGRGRKLVTVHVKDGCRIEGRVEARPCPEAHRTPEELLAEAYPGKGESTGGSTACRLCGGAGGYQPLGGSPQFPEHRRAHKPVPLQPGALVEAAQGRAADGSVMVLIQDHSPHRGSWRLRDARPDSEWDEIVAGLADGLLLDGWRAAHPERLIGDKDPRVVAAGYVAQGDAGRMGGGPAYLLVLRPGDEVEVVFDSRTVRLTVIDGELAPADPRAEAESRKASSAW